jgi:predicted DNA-binding transcriptional regulator AlpA
MAEAGPQVFDTKPLDSSSDGKPGTRLIKLADLFVALAVSKSTGHRLLASGRVGPRPIRLTAGTVRFDGAEVAAWMATRKPDGSFHDSQSWPPVWAAIKRRR